MNKYPQFAEALAISRSRGRLSRYPFLWNEVTGYFSCIQGGGSTMFDLSGYDNSGTLIGIDPVADWLPTEKGWALDYDGNGDRVDFGEIVPTKIGYGDASLTVVMSFSQAQSTYTGVAGQGFLAGNGIGHGIFLSADKIRYQVRQ